MRAPEIRGKDLVWFNVSQPLELAKLRGKLVILDFWTFCCINCIHILPSLARVEKAFPEEVVVIGVHTPKFSAERDPLKVADAIARYGIVHPVVHDPDFTIWRDYAIRGWPTLVIISPDGIILAHQYGEVAPHDFVNAIGNLLATLRKSGSLDLSELELVPVVAHSGRLKYPAKMKPVPGSAQQWAIADGGHHQILVVNDSGRERARYGSGASGLRDGVADEATFNSPQGLIATSDAIFVADTGNHAIRKIDRNTNLISTLAGTGKRGGLMGPSSPGRESELASPWDLEVLDNRLFFANAGTHQLGELNLASGQVRCLAGSGVEGIVDGAALSAHLAQPSGLAISADRKTLYFVDSETSALRATSLIGRPIVKTLVGMGLFEFGHTNGALSAALLQHPLGVACFGQEIFIADSYNNAVRKVDLAKNVINDFDEGEFLCADAFCLPLSEPAGLTIGDAEHMFVVDTNNHRILRYDFKDMRYRTWIA